MNRPIQGTCPTCREPVRALPDGRWRCGWCGWTGRPLQPPMPIRISRVTFTPASPADRDRGLLGYLEFVLNEALVIDGVTLRRTRNGRLALSFPSRRDRYGVEHFVITPLGDAARREIERQVFEAIGREVAE